MLRLNSSVITKTSAIFFALFCSINLFAMAHNATAQGICFFDATGAPAVWTDHGVATKLGFLKAMCKKAPHIFITPDIWQSFITIRQNLLGQL